MSSIQNPTAIETETQKQEEVPVTSNAMEVDSKPADLTDAKPTEAVAPAAVPAIVQADSEPVQTAVAEDKIEPVVQTQSDSETATPPIPIAKETVVEENKADEQAVAAAPTTTAGSSPKKEKKGIFARISGIFGMSSPDKKDKIHKAETPSKTATKTAPAIAATEETKTEAALVPDASNSTATDSVPTVVADETVKPSTEEVSQLTEGVNGLNIVEEPKKEITEAPVTITETGETTAVPKESSTIVAETKKDLNKPSPSTPKMHRRISARIGQYIDTRFGDKREKTASPPPIKKDGAVVEETSAGPAPETKAVEEVKTDVAPILAPPISVAPLQDVTAPVEAQTDIQAAKPVAASA